MIPTAKVARRDALTKAEEEAHQRWLKLLRESEPVFLSFEQLKLVRAGTLKELGQCARDLDKARRATAKVRGRQ
jgi:hypothetical protein